MKTGQINAEACRDASSPNAMQDGVIARRLLHKYEEIVRLRTERDAGVDRDVAARLKRLAALFPGALRELDRLPYAELDARVAALRAVADRGEALPRWAAVLDRFHAGMRATLHAKGASVALVAGDPMPSSQTAQRRVGRRLSSVVAAVLADEFKMAGREVEALLTTSVCLKGL